MLGTKGFLFIIALMVLIAPDAMSQDESAADTEAEEVRESAEDGTHTSDAGNEKLDTDDESYRDIDDEDFTPSEEIPADQSIAFPTDI